MSDHTTEESFLLPHAEAIRELELFTDLAWWGVGLSMDAAKWDRILRRMSRSAADRVPDGSEQRWPDRGDRIERLEKFAQHQHRGGFPYLYSLAVVRLLSIVEAAIGDAVLHLLRSSPEARSSEQVRKLKGPLIEFAQADSDSQAEFLLDLLKQEVRANLRPGVGRFESLLDAVGLGGPVDDNVRRSLLELIEVRNVIVHRNGRVDARLLEMCPWLTVRTGHTLIVSAQQCHGYIVSSWWYLTELSRRWAVLRGNVAGIVCEPPETYVEIADDLLQSLVRTRSVSSPSAV